MNNLVGKLFLTPGFGFYYKNNPVTDSNFKPKDWGVNRKELANQYVVVVDTTTISQIGSLYCHILFKNKQMYWIHIYDLIAINQKTGIPIVNY